MLTEDYESILESIKENRFKVIFKKQDPIGFFAWDEKWIEGKRHIFLYNTFILLEHRSKASLLFMRNFVRSKFPDMVYAYWHSKKRDRMNYHK